MAKWQRRKRTDGTADVATTDEPTPPTTDAATDAKTDPKTDATTGPSPAGTGSERAGKAGKSGKSGKAGKVSAADTTGPSKDGEPAGDVLVVETPALTEVPDDAIVVARRDRRRFRDAAPVLLLRAAHPRQAVLTALALGGAAAISGRASREAAVVLLTVLIGQTVLGWHNDIVDARRDARHDAENKPVADGRLPAGTVWYALVVAVLVLVPLSITTGITAGVYYLLSVAVAMLGHYVLRRGVWSWVPWAVSFGLLPFYLAHGGWGGQAQGASPEPVMVVLAAALGVGVHVVRAVWGLVADHADGWTYLPLRLGLRLGATRLLTLGGLYVAVVVAGLAVAATQVGLTR